MIFHVHTNQGVFKIEASTPEAARSLVRSQNPGIFIGKVKLAAGERSKPREKS